VRVIIDGDLVLDLPSPPRVGEIIAWGPQVRRVQDVVWWLPKTGRDGGAPTAEDISVHVQLEQERTEAAEDGR
jgi:hypothetical protein